MARSFIYQALPMRVVFGAGALRRLPDEIAALGLTRVLVLCSPEQEATGRLVADALGDRAAGVLPEARMHVPVEVARRARTLATELGADGCVAVGGGSAIGLGKAIALEHDLPVIAVPTTYAGSEMTPIWGLTEAGVKRTGRDPRVLPASVLYDPELTLTLPAGLSATSGMNAVAHAVEGLYAPDASPIVSLMAEEGVRALVAALPRVVADGSDLDARAEAQYGAWLCGAVLGATTMSLHHKLCHTLGGTLDLPHAPTHTVVLPHALAYNAPAAAAAVAALSRALGGAADPARELWDLAGRLGAPRSLRELGMSEDDIPRIADLAVASPYAKPRPVTREAVEELLRAAWSGEPPDGHVTVSRPRAATTGYRAGRTVCCGGTSMSGRHLTDVRISVLDTSPIVEGSTPRQALQNTVDLAMLADDLGYHRYWVAEHHGMRGVASTAPAVLVGHLANATRRIRVGAGGVLLPNHAPLVIAEQFATLAALHPGRIDLGLGRAPGGPAPAVDAVRPRDERTATSFPRQLDELHSYLDPPENARVVAIPALGGNLPAIWLLGSTTTSAQLAGERGLPYAYAHHLNPDAAVDATRTYREQFRASTDSTRPRILVSVSAIAADDDEHAEWLAGSIRLKMLSRFHGTRILLPSPEDAAAYPYTDDDRADITDRCRGVLVGSPDTLTERLQTVLDQTGADELVVTTPVYHHTHRRRSYELMASIAARLTQRSGKELLRLDSNG